MANKWGFRNSDIVILENGKIFQVLDILSECGGIQVSWLENDSDSIIFESERLHIMDVISQHHSNHAIAKLMFLTTKSVHLRLNNLNKV